MKKILINIFIFSMYFMLIGCESKSKIEIVEIAETGVSLSIKEDTLTPTSTTLILKNDSNSDIHYGNGYHIEEKKDEGWYYENIELVTTMPLMTLSPNTSIELEYNWENIYGKLSSGEYRIVKEYNLGDSQNDYYVVAEFIIE